MSRPLGRAPEEAVRTTKNLKENRFTQLNQHLFQGVLETIFLQCPVLQPLLWLPLPSPDRVPRVPLGPGGIIKLTVMVPPFADSPPTDRSLVKHPSEKGRVDDNPSLPQREVRSHHHKAQ